MAIGGFRYDAARAAYVAAYERAMRGMIQPDATDDVSTEFGTVRAYSWGDVDPSRAPVLLLPGRSAGAPMWQENLPDLIADRRIIAVDALGDAGLSVQTRPLARMEDQAQWIAQSLDALGVARVHVVGHSFGGATAMAFARYRPNRTSSFALLEPVFTLAWPPAAAMFWTVLASLPVPGRIRDRALAHIGGVDVSDVRERSPLSDMIAAGSRDFRASLPTPRVLSDADLAAIEPRGYVAIAERDSLAGGTRAMARAERAARIDAEVWAGTTHSLPMQVPAEIGARLRDFWDRVDGDEP